MVSLHVFAKPHSRRSFDFFSRPTTIPRPPSPKSHGIISFTDPHPLTTVVSYRYKNIGGGFFLILQTFNVELSTFDLLHSSPLFSLCYTLFSATGVPQPFVYQSLPHSFHRDGVSPLLSSASFEVQACGRYNVLPSYPLSFHILAHSFAHRKKLSHLFSLDSALFAQNTRGGGDVLKENRLAVVAFRGAADVFAGIHQPLIVGTVSFFQRRGFFPTLQARCSLRQGRGACSCCELGARLPRNLAAPFLAPSLHPQVRPERPRQISSAIPDRSVPRSWSRSGGCGCRESLPAFSWPLRRFQEPCCRRQACLAAVRERRGHAKLAALPNRRVSLRHARPAPAPAGNVVLPAGRAWAIPEEWVEPCFFSSRLVLALSSFESARARYQGCDSPGASTSAPPRRRAGALDGRSDDLCAAADFHRLPAARGDEQKPLCTRACA